MRKFAPDDKKQVDNHSCLGLAGSSNAGSTTAVPRGLNIVKMSDGTTRKVILK